MVVISVHQEVNAMMSRPIHADKAQNRYSDHANKA